MAEDTATAIARMTTPPTSEEMQAWYDEAVDKYALTRKMADIGFATYDPQPERIMRLLLALRAGLSVLTSAPSGGDSES
jgi:hypothetical protein